MYCRCLIATMVASVLVLAPASAHAQSVRAEETRDAAAFRRLQAQTGGRVAVTLNKATGGARFIRVPPGAPAALAAGRAATVAEKQQRSQAFFRDYAALLGVQDAAMLRFDSASTDRLGETHLTWRQFYREVPVFAAVLKTHFDSSQRLKAVGGTTVPDIAVNPVPSVARERAIAVALAQVTDPGQGTAALRAGTTTLYVYREGLAQGVPGANRLAWEVEVTNGVSIRELLYVDAHNAKVIDRVSGIHDDLRRRAYDGHDLAFVPQNYPNAVYWSEGQPFPTASTEANNMITASKETYDFFANSFGRDSFDDDGAVMDAIFDRGYSCPNASWNGVFISFCPGFTTDDVTAHEWGHAYTQYTHGLIYQWQPGALNEAYSDIYGEIIDRINNRGLDTPDVPRTANACSAFSPPVPRVRVNDPLSLEGSYLAARAVFGPALNTTGVTGDVAVALDAANAAGPTTFDACTAVTNPAAVSGKIALVNRGTCGFVVKAANVQAAGAIGMIVANNAFGLITMGGTDPAVTIPAVMIQQTDGTAIRNALTANTNVNATLLAQPGADDSYRWLMGEEVTDGGALRDMWNPTCYANPGKVSDPYYFCTADDGGGVHFNSGIPNHAFALLAEGGTYNGQTIGAIGLTKAAHIYYRAASEYQVPQSDFADHADALEYSCADLIGQPLNALTGGPSAEVISPADCGNVSKAILAVELRTPPPCAFAPLLSQASLPLCSPADTSGTPQSIFTEAFEAEPTGWSAASVPSGPLFTERNWSRVGSLPGNRVGAAFFAPDPDTMCPTPDDPDEFDESGVLQLTSPPIVLPADAAFPRATFEHWVATEPGWDGGNLKVSVNGGPWQLIPPSSYTLNGHNALLFSAEQGNTNPLAGQPAWTGNDNGTVNGGTWGRTHVNLAAFARAGDTIRLRWDFGTDVCAGRTGWFVDNVDVFSCTPNIPVVSAADISVTEGNSGHRDIFFTVRLSTRTVLPVTVNYSIADGTALHGDDILPVKAGTLVIPPGAIGVLVPITLKGDTTIEGDEVFFLNLSGAVNATITDPQAQATILDDDTPPGQ
jgi:Zn-dependent metalloprotease